MITSHLLCEISKLTFVLSSDDMDGPVEDIGSRSCVTRFVKTLLSIMEHGVKPHSKHLTEYFAFLYEFAKMGEEEVSVGLLLWELAMYMHVRIFKYLNLCVFQSQFLLSLQAISTMVHFYMGTKGPENVSSNLLCNKNSSFLFYIYDY